MYTSRRIFVPRILFFISETSQHSELRDLSHLEGATRVEKLQTIIAKRIAGRFGVGSPVLRENLAQASYDIAQVLQKKDEDFFISMIGSSGELMMNGFDMEKIDTIINSFRGKILSFDELLEYSPVK